MGPGGSEVGPGGSEVGPGVSKVGPGGSEVGPCVLQDFVPFGAAALLPLKST